MGSEECLRQFSYKCESLERILKFTLTCLKYENNFDRNRPFQSIFENDWDNLVGIVLFCAKNTGQAVLQIRNSKLSEEVHQNASILRFMIYTSEDETNDSEDASCKVADILHLVLECMHELIENSSPKLSSSEYSVETTSALAMRRLLMELDKNESARHNHTTSALSRTIRVTLLFYLSAVTQWLHEYQYDAEASNRSPVVLTCGLSTAEICQLCVYASSDDRSTQYLAGRIFQKLLEAEPKRHADLTFLNSALSKHSSNLPLELTRNTIFSMLTRRGHIQGHHGLKVILAWELQVQSSYIFLCIDIIYALLIFWLASPT